MRAGYATCVRCYFVSQTKVHSSAIDINEDVKDEKEEIEEQT